MLKIIRILILKLLKLLLKKKNKIANYKAGGSPWTAIVHNFTAFQSDFGVWVGTSGTSTADNTCPTPALTSDQIASRSEAPRGVTIAWYTLYFARWLVMVFLARALAGSFVTSGVVASGLVAMAGTANWRTPPCRWTWLISCKSFNISLIDFNQFIIIYLKNYLNNNTFDFAVFSGILR